MADYCKFRCADSKYDIVFFYITLQFFKNRGGGHGGDCNKNSQYQMFTIKYGTRTTAGVVLIATFVLSLSVISLFHVPVPSWSSIHSSFSPLCF